MQNVLEILKELIATHGESRFASFTYTNKQGETSHYLLHLNVNLKKVLARDLKVLRTAEAASEIEREALDAVIKSAETSLITDFHNPAYTKEGYYEYLMRGVKYHENQLYVNAFVVKRTVLTPGTYKEVKSKPLTIAKDKFRAMMKMNKFREFRLDLSQIQSVKMNGKILEFA